MHKKLFMAVLALGLLLWVAPAFASDTPSEVPVKAFGGGQSKAALTPTAEANPDPLVTVYGGQNRTVPGTFCDGNWYAPFGFTVGGWYVGNEFYAAYQDPSNPTYWNGTCVNTPSFDVTAINTIIRYSAGPFPLTAAFQPLVFDVTTGCNFDGVSNQPTPVAGGALCAGPLYAYTWNSANSFLLNMPFPVECCISGDYYAAYYAPTSAALRLGCTDGSMDIDPNGPASGTECLTFNDYGGGWDELTGNYFGCFNLTGVVPWGGSCNSLEHILYSEGYTPSDPATHCTPGNCGDEFWFDPNVAADFAFGLPSGSGGGRDRLGVWTEANGADTITAVTFAMNGPTPADPADLYLEIYAANFTGTACAGKMPGVADAPIFYDSIPATAITWGGYTTWTLSTPFVWGTLNGGPTQRIVVALGRVTGTGTTNGVLGNNDDGACTNSDHFVARYPALTEWLNIFDVSGIAPEPFIALSICREQLPAVEVECGPGGPDEWSQFAHDARQTSASSINVGDPNQVTLSWTQALPRLNSFNNPSVANDIVYISSDQEVRAYDLTTGAFIAQLQGAPEMGSSNRGNTTVAYVNALARDVVFASGGSFNAFSACETNLEASPVIWSKNPGNTPLLHQNRFNTSKVVDIAGTSVLFVCTEPAAGNGAIYAFDAATGALYPGWATNPVILDAAAKHGPAVNGGKLFVGTAIGGSNVSGSLYQIDAATGTIDWNFVGVPGEGWPSGVSTEGNFVYGATKDANNVGYRYKIDVSGAAPSVVWTSTQGAGLYGTPTIGRGFVYFPLDNPSFGLLQVSKDLGLVARNFAAEDLCGVSIYMVPQIVTLSCDGYLFAGDRNGRWWLLNAVTGDIEWYRDFPFITGGEIINGTALATAASGDSYAVVGIRQLFGLGGRVSAYKLNAGPRPRLIQCVHDETVVVPLGAGAGNPHSVADVFMNIGDQPLNFSALNITDPLPDGMAQARQNANDFRSAMASATAGFDGYTNYLSNSSLTKKQRMAGLSTELVDGEFMASELSHMAANENLLSTRSDARSMAAGAAAIRTSNVLVGGASVPTSIAPAGMAGLAWTYDGTGLGRGSDANDLEFTMNDPDFNYNGSGTAVFSILYQGGCLYADDTLHFNADGSYMTIYNHGALGDDPSSTHEFNFGADATTPDGDFFDGTFIVAGDSVAGGLAPDYGAQFAADMFGNIERYVPNVGPISGVCGLDKFTNVMLGAYRDGGCPGTPVDIHGEIIVTSFSDTNFAATPGTPGSSMGLDIVRTAVGAYDPLYGDFVMNQWAVTNRDAVAKGPYYAGTFIDWDINSASSLNTGLVSDVFNGVAQWDASDATIAYGALDLNQPHTYAGLDPTFHSPHKIWVLSNPSDVYDPAPWDMGDDSKLQTVWSQLVKGGAREVHGPAQEDKSSLLISKGLTFAPNGTQYVHQAIFGVDASINTAAGIEANAAALAKRAARFAGFARGDVNDDGVVDLADVCWLQGGNYIYPAAYSGDVNADGLNNAADIAKLLSYVSGNAADQPVGAWRF